MSAGGFFGRRAFAYTVSLTLVGAVLWPLQQNEPKDGFPLSTYPMFSRKRPTELSVDHVVAVSGTRHEAVPPELVASGEVLQAKATITQKLRRGRRGAEELCRQVAERLRSDDDWRWAEHVEVRSDRYLVLGYFSGAKKPIWSRRHARCALQGAR